MDNISTVETTGGKKRKENGFDMSDYDAKQILLNLVDRYEAGYGKLSESINTLNIGFSVLSNEVKTITERVSEIQTTLAGEEKKFGDMFARKIVETIVFTGVGIVLVGVLTALLGLVIVKAYQ